MIDVFTQYFFIFNHSDYISNEDSSDLASLLEESESIPGYFFFKSRVSFLREDRFCGESSLILRTSIHPIEYFRSRAIASSCLILLRAWQMNAASRNCLSPDYDAGWEEGNSLRSKSSPRSEDDEAESLLFSFWQEGGSLMIDLAISCC